MSVSYYKQRTRSYYDIVSSISIRNIKLRYKNSALGFLWSLLSPLVFLSIFVFIFNQAFADIDNYPLYAITGLIFWIFFSTTSTQIMNSFVESAGILKSLNIPPIIFPISSAVASLINLLLSFIPFFMLMLLFGFRPDWVNLLLIPFLVLFAVFTFGFSLILASVNVYFRDVGMLWNTLIPALLYITPVAYTSTLVPDNLRWVMVFNPLYHYMEVFRDVLYYNRVPSLFFTVSTLLLAVVFFSIGLVVFKKLKKGFVSYY